MTTWPQVYRFEYVATVVEVKENRLGDPAKPSRGAAQKGKSPLVVAGGPLVIVGDVDDGVVGFPAMQAKILENDLEKFVGKIVHVDQGAWVLKEFHVVFHGGSFVVLMGLKV